MHPFWVQDEKTARGAAEIAAGGASIIAGFESCTTRILTNAVVVLMVGIQSLGQGLDTALSQVAAEELGIAAAGGRPAARRDRHLRAGRGDRSPAPWWIT